LIAEITIVEAQAQDIQSVLRLKESTRELVVADLRSMKVHPIKGMMIATIIDIAINATFPIKKIRGGNYIHVHILNKGLQNKRLRIFKRRMYKNQK
jgi:hypothetical protein